MTATPCPSCMPSALSVALEAARANSFSHSSQQCIGYYLSCDLVALGVISPGRQIQPTLLEREKNDIQKASVRTHGGAVDDFELSWTDLRGLSRAAPLKDSRVGPHVRSPALTTDCCIATPLCAGILSHLPWLSRASKVLLDQGGATWSGCRGTELPRQEAGWSPPGRMWVCGVVTMAAWPDCLAVLQGGGSARAAGPLLSAPANSESF